MDRIRIAIIGTGKQAPKHVGGLRTVPGVEIVLTDADPESARALANEENLGCIPEVEDVFEDPSIRAVVICTPTPSHAGVIESALKSGKDFFCEKPLCEGISEARRIKELTDQQGAIAMVGYIYRFVPVYELGHRLFEDVPGSGESVVLGRIVSAQLRLGGRGSHQVWKHRKDSGGGVISEMLVHMLDLAIWYFGAVEKVRVLACDILRPTRMIRGKLVEVDAEDYVLVRLTMESGVDVFCQADLVTPAFTQSLEVQGENGTFMGSIQQDMPSFVFCEDARGGYSSGRTPFQFKPHSLFAAQMAEFVQAVRTRRSPSRCTIKDSILLKEVLEKLRREI